MAGWQQKRILKRCASKMKRLLVFGALKAHFLPKFLVHCLPVIIDSHFGRKNETLTFTVFISDFGGLHIV